MKNLIIAPVVLSLLAVTLTGCNDEDDPIFGSGSSSNEFTVISFDKGIDRQTNKEAIVRINDTYSSGDREVKVTNIVGNYNTQNIDDLETSIVLADQFEGTLEDENIEVNNRTIKRPIYEKNSNNKLDYEITYRTLSLSGVNARDYLVGNRFNDNRGILTDLNNYPKIPNNTSFPNGSVCYIPVIKSARSLFVFNDKNKTGYEKLDNWVEDTENRFNDNRQSSTTTLKVGKGNNLRVKQVKFFAINSAPEYLYNGIDYDDRIYEANYIDKNKLRPNEDSLRGVVNCTLVNDVAADFLEREIKRYY